MAEQGTEAGSPQRKKKAREQGDSVRSRELLSAAAMLAGVLALGAVAQAFTGLWRLMLERSLASALRPGGLDRDGWVSLLRGMLAPLWLPLGTVMAASFAAALATGLAQGGGVEFHPAAIGFKPSKLNPVSNFSNLFSLRSGTRLAKSLVPAAVMVLLGFGALRHFVLPMPVLSILRLPTALNAVYQLALDAAAVSLVWSALDYAVEWLAWNKRMKMTKQQVRDEIKETMGNPQVKGRVRQAQNAMRRRKVKADMSRATVVITNPTHYAVALEFSFDTMSAPTVLAKGRDLHAAEIREAARWASVPLIENPPLARSLYRAVEAGQTIPFELYAAVAGILAFLYRGKVEDQQRRQREDEGRRQARSNAAQAQLDVMRSRTEAAEPPVPAAPEPEGEKKGPAA